MDAIQTFDETSVDTIRTFHVFTTLKQRSRDKIINICPSWFSIHPGVTRGGHTRNESVGWFKESCWGANVCPLIWIFPNCVTVFSMSYCAVSPALMTFLFIILSIWKIHEDEGLNSKIYEGFQKYQFDKSSKVFIPDAATAVEGEMKKRYFVSLMSESLIKKGVFFRLRKRVRVSFIFDW